MPGFDNEKMNAQGSDVGTFPNSENADNSTEFQRSGSDVTSIVNNTSDTAGSGASQTIRVEGTNASEAYTKWQVGDADSWAAGMDASDTPSMLRFAYRNDGDATPSNFTNLAARFEPVNTVSGASKAVFTTEVDIASEGTASGGDVILNLQNVEVAANSDAVFVHQTGLGGNPYRSLSSSAITNAFFDGVDTSDGSLKWQVGTSGFPGSSDAFVITQEGEVTFPLSPAFFAFLPTTDANVTGDGTRFFLGTGNNLTESFDRNNDFDPTTGIFTAPIAGLYLFQAGFLLDQIGAAHTQMDIKFHSGGNNFSSFQASAAAIRDSANFVFVNGSYLLNLPALGTVTTSTRVANSTLTVDVGGGGLPNIQSYFSGRLVA